MNINKKKEYLDGLLAVMTRKELLRSCRMHRLTAHKAKTNAELAEILYEYVYVPLNGRLPE